MGTLVRIVLYADTPAAGDAAAQARVRAHRRDRRRASATTATTARWRRCRARAADVPVPVSEDLFAVLAASDALARRTGGAFDITAGRLTHLWRRARRLNAWPERGSRRRRPRRRRLRQGRGSIRGAAPSRSPRPGSRSTPAASPRAMPPRRRCASCARMALAPRWSRSAATSPPGSAARAAGLDGGDPRARRLRRDVGARGRRRRSFPIALVRAAVSTSGDAEQWMTVDGVRRSHVIDLRTGWPVTGRSAISVVAAHGIDADALSTALDVLDDGAGARLLAAFRGPGSPRARAIDGPGALAARRRRWQRRLASFASTGRRSTGPSPPSRSEELHDLRQFAFVSRRRSLPRPSSPPRWPSRRPCTARPPPTTR